MITNTPSESCLKNNPSILQNENRLSDLPKELIFSILKSLTSLDIQALGFANKALSNHCLSFLKTNQSIFLKPYLRLFEGRLKECFPIWDNALNELEEKFKHPGNTDDFQLNIDKLSQNLSILPSLTNSSHHPVFQALISSLCNLQIFLKNSKNFNHENWGSDNYKKLFRDLTDAYKKFSLVKNAFTAYECELKKNFENNVNAKHLLSFYQSNRNLRIGGFYLYYYLFQDSIATRIEQESDCFALEGINSLQDLHGDFYHKEDLNIPKQFILKCLRFSRGGELLSMFLSLSPYKISHRDEHKLWLEGLKKVSDDLEGEQIFPKFARAIIHLKKYLPNDPIHLFIDLRKHVCLILLKKQKTDLLAEILSEMPTPQWTAIIINDLIIKNELTLLSHFLLSLKKVNPSKFRNLLYYADLYLKDESLDLSGLTLLENYKPLSLKQFSPLHTVAYLNENEEYDSYIDHCMGYFWLAKKIILEKRSYQEIDQFIFSHQLFSENLFKLLCESHENFEKIAYFFYKIIVSDQLAPSYYKKFSQIFCLAIERQTENYLKDSQKNKFVAKLETIFLNSFRNQNTLGIDSFSSILIEVYLTIGWYTENKNYLFKALDLIQNNLNNHHILMISKYLLSNAERKSFELNNHSKLLISDCLTLKIQNKDYFLLAQSCFDTLLKSSLEYCLDNEVNFFDHFDNINYKKISNFEFLDIINDLPETSAAMNIKILLIYGFLNSKIYDKDFDPAIFLSDLREIEKLTINSIEIQQFLMAAKSICTVIELDWYLDNQCLEEALPVMNKNHCAGLTGWIARGVLYYKGYKDFISFAKRYPASCSLELYKICIDNQPSQLILDHTCELLSLSPQKMSIVAHFIESQLYKSTSLVNFPLILMHIKEMQKSHSCFEISKIDFLIEFLIQTDFDHNQNNLASFQWIFELLDPKNVQISTIGNLCANIEAFINKLGYSSLTDQSFPNDKKNVLQLSQLRKLINLHKKKFNKVILESQFFTITEAFEKIPRLMHFSVLLGLSLEEKYFNKLLKFLTKNQDPENYNIIEQIRQQHERIITKEFVSAFLKGKYFSDKKVSTIKTLKKLHLIHLILKFDWPLDDKINLNRLFATLIADIEPFLTVENSIPPLIDSIGDLLKKKASMK